MNEKNFNYLKDQVKYTGFGNALESQLKQNMEQGLPEFTLQHQASFGKDEATASLHFRKSTETDNYFMNRYDLALKREGESEPVKQTFYIGYDNNVTFKEGYNLMSGRAVHKELAKLIDTSEPGLPPRLEAKGEKYTAWLKMDFSDRDKQGNFKMKQFTDAHGFKLDEALAKYPIKELRNEDDKISLMGSLQKGNRQAVTFLMDGKEEKRFIEANPQHWSVNIYDANMEKLDYKKSRGKGESESAQQSEGQQTTTSQDKKQTEELSDAPQKKAGKSRKKGITA